MRKSDFHYELPVELVAQEPAEPRSAARLLCLDRASGAIADRRFVDVPKLLRAGDLLVFNDTRVVPARLHGAKASGGRVEVLIERVLCNLLENASKYTPCGSWICIAAEQRGAVLAITVQDNGPGLPANLEEVIFEKFIRGASESSTPGIGLGLSICLAIMEAHHGTIYFEAPVGGGASFVFTIPLGDVPPMPDLVSR